MSSTKEHSLGKNVLRWNWFGILVCQLELTVLLLLLSIRSVWNLINKTLDSVIGLGEYSFLTIYFILILFSILSVSFLRATKIQVTKRIFFIVQIVLFASLFLMLYPQLKSMYISQLPFWLFKERVIVLIIIFSAVFGWYYIKKFTKRKDPVLNGFIVLNALLLVFVLSFGWIAATVRSSGFSKNSIEKRLESSKEHFVINSEELKSDDCSETDSICPDISIKVDMVNGGNYIEAGDLTGDGIVEIITLKYWVEPIDVNRIKSLAVQSLLLDSISEERGKTIWSWHSDYEAPNNIGGGRGSSAAIAIFDLKTGQANKKLLMATDGWLYEFTFDSKGFVSEKKVPTGRVNASDCMIIANLDGDGKHQLLLKDAYHTIWAYDEDLNLLWKVKNPGGYLLSHRITALDINKDGKDEILAGATILNDQGEVISHLKTDAVKLWYGGHIDGIVPIEQNGKWHIAVTYCDGLGIGLFDFEGNLIWEVTSWHFEYLVGGYFFNSKELKNQFQVLSKVHYKDGSPQVMMNQDGKLLGIFSPSSPMFSVDWNGNGYHEIVFSSPVAIWSETKRMVNLLSPDDRVYSAFSLRVADMLGNDIMKPDAIPDIVVREIDCNDDHYIHIYTNRNGRKPLNYVYPGIGWESSANYFTKYYDYNRETDLQKGDS